MDLARAVLLGIVQGLTEYLPVSSSGHLVVLPALLGWPEPSLTFDSAVHAGTAGAVLWYYRSEWRSLLARGLVQAIRRPRAGPPPESRLLALIAIGTAPAVVVGVAFEGAFAALFAAPNAAAAMLIVTGALLAGTEWLARRRPTRADPSVGVAVAMGAAQALAILPGLSRSGTTIAAGMLAGLDRPGAARFSFLMAGPITAGVFAYELAGRATGAGEPVEAAGAIAAGLVAAFVSGYVAVDWLLAFVRRSPLYPFAIYCWGVGLVSWWFLR